MPLFECSRCGCVDNTALGNFWMQLSYREPPLCVECDPAKGKWHGEFDRETVSQYEERTGDTVEYKSTEKNVRDPEDGKRGDADN